MASDDMPDAAFTHTVRGFFGEELTIVAYAPVDDEDGGAVEFVIKGDDGRTASAHISSPAEREALARAWMEACRIADGEVPATEAQDEPAGEGEDNSPFTRHDAPYPGPGKPCPHDGGKYAPGFRCAACGKRDRQTPPVHLPSGGERVESAVHRLLGLPEGF